MSTESEMVLVPLTTLQWWRQLVDLNPADLAPRIDSYLTAAPASPAVDEAWEWEQEQRDCWTFTIPRIEYSVAFSVDENSGEVWHAYCDRFGPEQDGELADEIGVYRTKGEAQAACVKHRKESGHD